MPQLGETVTEGTITKWLKKIGDKVVIDEVLFEVSTDKVDSEVPSTATGYVTAILAAEGDTIAVGTVLATVEDSIQETHGEEGLGTQPPPTPAELTYQEPVASAPTAPPEPRVAPVVQETPMVQAPPGIEGLVLSPVVRRLISENSIDPNDIDGTGAGGRITRSDALDYLDQKAMSSDSSSRAQGFVPADRTSQTNAGEPSLAHSMQSLVEDHEPNASVEPSTVFQRIDRVEPYSPVSASARDEVIPFNNIRRRTAEHMVRSKATSAHTLVAIEVDFEPVERVRSLVKDAFVREEGFPLTYLPFISRATVEAIRTFPRINSSVGDDELIVHRDLNLAIAVDLDLDGLIAPVIHGADQMRLKGIARKIRDLATRARTKRLSADELAGGTFTITNPGPYGTFMTVPIINQPQVAILSTDGIKRKPVVITLPDGSESIAIHSVGVLALSFDHRVIDGAYAAAFLARMKEIIETWTWAQEF